MEGIVGLMIPQDPESYDGLISGPIRFESRSSKRRLAKSPCVIVRHKPEAPAKESNSLR
jgi:hypothetical protein